MAQHSVTTHHEQGRKSLNAPAQGGIELVLKKHRRTLIFAGAAILLATYFLKDVASDKAKDEIGAMRAAESQYRASLSLQQDQLRKLFDAAQMLKAADAKALSRISVLATVGDLTVGSGQISQNLFWFAMSCLPGAPKKESDEAGEVLHRTTVIHGEAEAFLAHSPADADAFKAGAQTMIEKLTTPQNNTAEAGTGLQVYELGALEDLERKSSRYGGLITALFLLGLVLNTLGALHGVETPKEG
jgi:hypothetical protein